MTFSWFLTGPLLYVAAAVFVGGSLWKIVSLARLPRHLRWDLYPMPGLGPEGSKYQQVDFGKASPHDSRLREAAFMAEEILLLKKVFRHGRGLWLGSWLMHWGLYLGAAFFALLVLGALLELAGWQGMLLQGVSLATIAAGGAALSLGTVGCLLLGVRRLTDPGLRAVADVPTYVNLGLLLALFATGAAAWLTGDLDFLAARAHVASLLSGSPGSVPPVPAVHLVLLGVFFVYLPFSRMFHFAAKYFTYHWILWESAAMQPGSALERRFAAYLAYRPDWAAPHVRPGATWAGQADADRERTEP